MSEEHFISGPFIISFSYHASLNWHSQFFLIMDISYDVSALTFRIIFMPCITSYVLYIIPKWHTVILPGYQQIWQKSLTQLMTGNIATTVSWVILDMDGIKLNPFGWCPDSWEIANMACNEAGVRWNCDSKNDTFHEIYKEDGVHQTVYINLKDKVHVNMLSWLYTLRMCRIACREKNDLHITLWENIDTCRKKTQHIIWHITISEKNNFATLITLSL